MVQLEPGYSRRLEPLWKQMIELAGNFLLSKAAVILPQ